MWDGSFPIRPNIIVMNEGLGLTLTEKQKEEENTNILIHYPSDMFSSAASLCSLAIFLFQHSFPISLAPSVCRSAPTQPPDLFFGPDSCCILDGLCLRFPSTPETFNFRCNLTVTSEVIRLTFLRLLRCRLGLLSVKESDSGQEGCLVLTGPLMTERHRFVEVMSSESLQLATEAAMVEEGFCLYPLVSSKLDSEASIQHRLCSSG